MPPEWMLLRWVLRFWRYAVRETKKGALLPPKLLHVCDNWEDWWKGALSNRPAAQQQIQQLVEGLCTAQQARFVELIQHWSRRRFKEHAEGCAWVLLVQLAQLEQPNFSWLRRYVFDSWLRRQPGHLESLHAPHVLHVNGVPGPNALLLHQNQGGFPDDITPLRAALIPQESAPSVVLYSMSPDDRRWYPYPIDQDGYKAVVSLFGGGGFGAFLLYWGLRGWVARLSRVWPWLLIWFLIDLTLVLILGSERLADSTEDRGVLVPLLWGLLGAVWLPVSGILHGLGREWRHVRERRGFLTRSQLVIVAAHVQAQQVQVHVEGRSLGMAMYISSLAALYAYAPASTSALAWCVDRMKQALATWSCTGALKLLGKVGEVGRIEDKIAASAVHPAIIAIVMSWQKIPQPARRVAAQAKLRVYRCWHIVSVLFTIGWLDCHPIATRLACVVSLGIAASFVLLLSTLPQISQMLLWPPAPQLLVRESGFYRNMWGGAGDDYLRLAFDGTRPDACLVHLNSPYWANRAQRIHQSPAFPRPGVLLRLDKLSQPSGNDPFDGDLAVVCPRAILWRTLRPVVIERLPVRYITIHD